GRPAAWRKSPPDVIGMSFDAKGALHAVLGKSRELVRIDVATREIKTLADRHDGERFVHPRRLIGDQRGGVYFSDDPPADARRPTGSIYYLSAHGTLSRTSAAPIRPRGLGLSPNGKTLYVCTGSGEVLAVEVESAGSLGKSRVLGRLGRTES